ncbi:predicted protein [Coccidioides posadasii str. Silveira]|uniref:Predicted protein n=1 Tax=Coccidioides posadasii (strain RMSCC 757 / Silveira) TaxID=443226 RepID=E9DHZ2_COCPS|nr:predicted protein [Coccidioides posadasii str. Silveira]
MDGGMEGDDNGVWSNGVRDTGSPYTSYPFVHAGGGVGTGQGNIRTNCDLQAKIDRGLRLVLQCIGLRDETLT